MGRGASLSDDERWNQFFRSLPVFEVCMRQAECVNLSELDELNQQPVRNDHHEISSCIIVACLEKEKKSDVRCIV